MVGSVAGNNPANAVDCTNSTTEGGNTDLDGTALVNGLRLEVVTPVTG